jgi:hypothetical protein
MLEYVLGLSCTRPMKVPLSVKLRQHVWTKVLEYFSGAIFVVHFVERIDIQIATDGKAITHKKQLVDGKIN